MYEQLKIEVIFLHSEDIVKTSPIKPWRDENVNGTAWI